MATSLSASVSSATKGLFQNAQPFNITFSGNVNRAFDLSLGSGATKIYFNNYTSSGATSIDLTSLVDAYGNAISFATVKHLMIVNNDATNAVTVGGGTTPLLAALPSLVAGGCFNLTTHFTVAPTTKLLKLTPAAGTPSIDLVILGL